LYFKVLFMTEFENESATLRDVKDIRQMMERSSKFISLSGLSGVAAGVSALAGAAIARYVFFERYYKGYNARGTFDSADYATLRIQLILLAAAVFGVAFLSAFYFTWKKSAKQGLAIWNSASRRLFWNMIIPLFAGGFFILGMLQHNEWRFVTPACLMFYGLALVNASKYTLSDIRYLGFCEIILGIISLQFVGYSLYFWALGFGVLHILYGISMWWKYERKSTTN
jgi:hypothetical protein